MGAIIGREPVGRNHGGLGVWLQQPGDFFQRDAGLRNESGHSMFGGEALVTSVCEAAGQDDLWGRWLLLKSTSEYALPDEPMTINGKASNNTLSETWVVDELGTVHVLVWKDFY
jgi:hypothetical protein